MDKETIKNKVVEIVIENVNPSLKNIEIDDNANLIDYGMSSLSFIRMIVALEDEFNIEFDEMSDSSQFRTINKILKYVCENV